MRLSRRFAVVGAAAALVPLLAYGVVSITALREGTRQSVGDGLVNLTQRTAAQLDGWLERTAAQLAALAAEFDGNRLERWQQERAVRNWVLRFPEFRELTVFDSAERPAASSRLVTEGARLPRFDREGPHGTRFSRISIDDDLLPVMHVAVTFDTTAGTRETLVGTLNLEQIWRVVDQLRVGRQGYALLVDDRGRLFAHGHPDRKGAIVRGEPMDTHPLARAALGSGEGLLVPEEYVDAEGVRRLAVAARIPATDWLLLLEQPTSEAFGLADRLQRWLVGAIGVALAVMIALGAWLGRSLIAPITTLVGGTDALAAGNLDARVSLRSGDEFERLGEAFNHMAERLSELQDAARRQERQVMFGRIASGLLHDLAHPVQNLANNSRLLLRRPDDVEFRQVFARTVERETAAMKRVLDDLRQVGTPIPLERFRVDLTRNVRDAVEGARAAADTAGLSLEFAPGPDPIHVQADAFALGRVWRNLLQNAIDATPSGGGVVVSTGREATSAWVRVRDTGRGIEPDRLPRLFEEFETTKPRGLGLGLAICKRIVEQLGGRIAVESVAGAGTTFAVWLPLATEAPGDPATSDAARTQTGVMDPAGTSTGPDISQGPHRDG
jgi:signal transduction histidine kinase